MRDSIDLLIQLQDMDVGVAKLKIDIDKGINEQKRLENEKNEIETRITELENSMKEFDIQLHQKTLDVEEAKASIAKFREQRNFIKKPRELFALDREIENVLKTMKTVEAEMKKVDADKIAKQDDFNKEQEFSTQKNEEISIVETKNNEMKASTQTTLDEYDAKRKALVEQIPDELLKLYNFLYEKMDGKALAKIQDEACSECFINLPPQLINEVKRGDKIIRCPSCQRILYVRD